MSEAPRLVQIAEFDRPHAGSFVPVLDGLLRCAAARGWRAEVVLPARAARASWVDGLGGDARVRLAPEQILGSRLARSRWLAEQLRDGSGPIVLHSHFTMWDVAALLAAHAPGVPAGSVFWHVHSALPRDPAQVARGTFKFGLLGRGVAGIICPAPNIALGVMQRLAPRDRVHFLPSALDAAAHPLADEAARASARRELGIPQGARVILHFGWHNYLKGTDIFLRTVRELVDADDSIVALIRGHEPVSESQTRELGLGDHVRFQPPVPSAPTLFAAADALISSSREEGMAYTVLEAVAAGTPVVATPIPGHTFIADSVDACRISRRDPEALAAMTLEVLAESTEQREREGRQAHEWIAEHLSIGAIAERMVDLYEDSIAKPRRRTHPRIEGVEARPRVIQVVQFANPNPGSFVPMIAAAGRVAGDAGAEPEVILGDGSAGHPWVRDLRAAGVRVRFAPAVGRDGMRRWLREVIDETDAPTILHTHFTSFDIAAAIAASGIDRARVAWHIHSALHDDPVVYVRNRLKFTLVARLADRLICPSPELERSLLARGAPAAKVEFVPNGIDPARFAPASPERRRDARAALGIPADAPVALGFAWNWKVKGGELFVRTVAAARSAVDGLHAIQVTRDPRSRELAARLGVGDVIKSIAPQSDVGQLYAASDVLLATSEREGGTPFGVLEALSSGLPVVASDIASHRFIAERADGVRIQPRDSAPFAAALAAALVPERVPGGPSGGLPRELTLAGWSERIAAIYAELGVPDRSSSRM